MDAAALDRIGQLYGELTPTHKVLADLVLEHPDQVAFLSTHQLAHRADTSATTVVRFVQVLGYATYDAFLDALQDYLRTRITPLSKLQDTLSAYGGTTSPLAHAIEEDARALQQALADFSEEVFSRAIDLIDRAQHVYLVGMGISYAVAYALEFRMRRLGLDALALGSGGTDLIEGLLALGKRDAVVVIGYHRPHPELFVAIDRARECQAPIVALTDSLHSPLARQAEVVLCAKRGPVRVLSSLAVPMSVANALAIGLAQKREAVASQKYAVIAAMEDNYAHHVEQRQRERRLSDKRV